MLIVSSGAVLTHTLFIPEADPLETMWSVPPPTMDEALAAYDTDQIEYLSKLESAISSLGDIVLHTLPQTLDYPALPSCVYKRATETQYLLDALQEARITKDAHEIGLIREANRIASGAHEVLMRELGRFASGRVSQLQAANGHAHDPLANGNAEESKLGVKERSVKLGVSQWEVESEGDAEALFVATCRRAG